MSGWLSGNRVIDLTDQRGLLTGNILARLGMEVIQIESITGSTARNILPMDSDGASFFWSAYAAGKRAITLDWEKEEGKELLLDLIKESDFLIESDHPSKLSEAGISKELIFATNPKIIYVSITPFGCYGPKSNYEDSEIILWASGGALYANRDSSSPPLRISVPQAYLHAAADAAVGALIAHSSRAITGKGQHVDISVQQSVTQATLASHLSAAVGHFSFTMLPTPEGKNKTKKSTLDLSGSGARTRRSKWEVVDGYVEMHLGMGPASGLSSNNLFAWMISENSLSERFHSWNWLEIPKKISVDEISQEDLDEARLEISSFLSRYTKSELTAEALKRRIMLAPVSKITDLLESPHLSEREFFQSVKEKDKIKILPGDFAKANVDGMFSTLSGAPELGQDNNLIYKEILKLNELRIQELKELKVI